MVIDIGPSKLSQQIDQNDRRDMLKQQKLLGSFFKRILASSVPSSAGDGAFNSIMVWPFSPQEPQYRDNYPP